MMFQIQLPGQIVSLSQPNASEYSFLLNEQTVDGAARRDGFQCHYGKSTKNLLYVLADNNLLTMCKVVWIDKQTSKRSKTLLSIHLVQSIEVYTILIMTINCRHMTVNAVIETIVYLCTYITLFRNSDMLLPKLIAENKPIKLDKPEELLVINL